MTAVREATATDHSQVARVLEGALLDVPIDLQSACRDGRVLVAGDPVVGAILVTPPRPSGGTHIVALAVVPSRRQEGIGEALIRAALKRPTWRPLSATARADVRGFYDALGFAIVCIDNERIRAVRGASQATCSR